MKVVTVVTSGDDDSWKFNIVTSVTGVTDIPYARTHAYVRSRIVVTVVTVVTVAKSNAVLSPVECTVW